jgi:hypothetical protein
MRRRQAQKSDRSLRTFPLGKYFDKYFVSIVYLVDLNKYFFFSSIVLLFFFTSDSDTL